MRDRKSPFAGATIIQKTEPSFHERFTTWRRADAVLDMERQRVAFLNDPRHLPRNDPRLFEKIKVMVIKPFYVDGILQTPESGIILLARHLAESLQASNKVEIIHES